MLLRVNYSYYRKMLNTFKSPIPRDLKAKIDKQVSSK